jgi:hypothetical protein
VLTEVECLTRIEPADVVAALDELLAGGVKQAALLVQNAPLPTNRSA